MPVLSFLSHNSLSFLFVYARHKLSAFFILALELNIIASIFTISTDKILASISKIKINTYNLKYKLKARYKNLQKGEMEYFQTRHT